MAKKIHPLALTSDQLTRRCTLDKFAFENTSELPSIRTIYGQPRGVRAIEFGIDIRTQGYNIYVLGPSGSGRVTAIRQFINERAAAAPTPDDWCYVHDFKHPHKPRALRLPAGNGQVLKRDVHTFIQTLRDEIPRVLDGEAFRKARNQITNQFEDQREEAISRVQRMAAEMSFALQTTPQGVVIIVPISEGEPMSPDAVDQLPDDARAEMNEKRRLLEAAVEEGFHQTRASQREAEKKLDALRRDMTRQVIDAYMKELTANYSHHDDVLQYLQDVREDVLDMLGSFEQSDESPGDEEAAESPVLMSPVQNVFRRYEVNVLVEHEPGSGAPVVFLDLPTYRNLVGRIEHEARFGMLTTDFTLIKAGALHRANSGFLIVRVVDILRQPFVWEALKRALATEQVVIEDTQSSGMSVMATQTVEPEPIPLNVTVVLVGSSQLYYALYNMEDDFNDLFRVKADFGEYMSRDDETEMHYATFIATRCHEENLPHFTKAAVGRIVEYGSWLVSDQRKLSTQFGIIAPLVSEAAFYARRHKHKFVSAKDVDEAIRERDYRNNEPEELSLENIAEGSIYIDVTGEVIGQVNGLVVMTMGDHVFGAPSRITARVFMGREGIVHIDRESNMTGSIHDKGVLTLQGYLGGRYAQDYPLNINATISFEQNYSDVDGDSASSTELYALLSAISGFPLRQDLAVTGSVNQRGQIQPIGGISQKIEGFFNVCKMHDGLTGSQGVLIPKANVPELMLKDEVIAAVKKGKFHVYAIETVDEGITLLTGKSAEEVHAAVDNNLRELARRMEDFGNGDHKSDDDDPRSDDETEEKSDA